MAIIKKFRIKSFKSTKPLIKLQRISLSFGKRQVLDDINFESSFKLSILTLTNTTNSSLYGVSDINFANLLNSTKLFLIIFMIIGKIELISILILFKKLLFKE